MSAIGSAVQHIKRWRSDIISFVKEQLRAVPDKWQVRALRSIQRNKRVCMKASKGPGKSTVLAWAAWWFLVCFAHPKVVCTSITEDNLRDGLWAEMSKWQQKSEFLKAHFTWSAERIWCNDAKQTWWMSARTWAKGASADQQANTLAGLHADAVMFIVDEAGGVPDAVVAAAEGGLANADKSEGRIAKLVLAGNPTHTEGPLFRASTVESGLWDVIEISGDPDDPERAPRVSIEWAREQIQKYGREHPFVLVNVFGKFPPQSANTLFGPDTVREAMKRDIEPALYRDEVKIMGVDVARHGDDRTVIALRQGRLVFMPRILRIADTMRIAAEVARAINEHKPAACFIDMATFGAGVVDRLRQLHFPVIGVFAAEKPVTDTKYANRRAEMWFRMSEWLTNGEGGVLPNIPELVAELTVPTYHFDAHDKLALEKKADIKKRTGTSPDIADAIGFTFAQPVASREVQEELGAIRDGDIDNPLDRDPYGG
jgi:hypothetical protein